jgi:hypothetical protein
LRTRFGIGETHELDIAYRDPQTFAVYAWNNDDYNHDLFRKPEHELVGGKFNVEVHLLGSWVDETFVFKFNKSGTGPKVV